MKITMENGANGVLFNYNDLVGAPNLFFKKRLIMKSAVMQLKLATDESYIEVTYRDNTKEQFDYSFFEGYESNDSLYTSLVEMLM